MQFLNFSKPHPFIGKPPSILGAQHEGVILLPARKLDGTKGFISRTQIAPGGKAFAALTVTRALLTHIGAMSRLCARNHEEAMMMAVAPDSWGGSLEDEEIDCSCMLVSPDFMWFKATTVEGHRLETLKQPIDVVLNALNDGGPYVALA